MESRIGCLLITHLPAKAELVRRPELAGRPVMVASGAARRRLVIDASPEAQAAGVRAGQPLAKALSRCADAVALSVDETNLSEVNDAMLTSLLEVVDRVEPAGWGEFYLDLTGLAPMYGGKTALASAILAAIDAAWQPRLGLATGKFPAYCAAASAKPGDWFKAPADAARWLRPWPASWLPLSPDAVARLRDFGIRTLGDAAAVPPDALTDFLGGAGERVWQLSQGLDADSVHPTDLSEVLRERLEFPFPVDTVPGWEAGVRTLSERVWRNPTLRGRSATEALLEGETETGDVWSFQRALPRLAATDDGLSAALLAALNAHDSRGRGRWPDAALLDLSLTVSGLTPLRGRQTGLWPSERRGASVPVVAGVDKPVALSPDSPLPERRWALGTEFRPLGQPAAVSVTAHDDCPKSVDCQPVQTIIDLWEVDTDWWTPEPAWRRYWQTLLAGGGLATVYHDLAGGTWRRQGG